MILKLFFTTGIAKVFIASMQFAELSLSSGLLILSGNTLYTPVTIIAAC